MQKNCRSRSSAALASASVGLAGMSDLGNVVAPQAGARIVPACDADAAVACEDRRRGDAVERFEPPPSFESVKVELSDILAERDRNLLDLALRDAHLGRDANLMSENAHDLGRDLESAGHAIGFDCDVNRRMAVEQEIISLGDQRGQLLGGCCWIGATDDEFRPRCLINHL